MRSYQTHTMSHLQEILVVLISSLQIQKDLNQRDLNLKLLVRSHQIQFRLIVLSFGSGGLLSNIVTVRTKVDHELSTETPIKISGIDPNEYNISTLVATVVDSKTFTYLLPTFPQNLTSPVTLQAVKL